MQQAEAVRKLAARADAIRALGATSLYMFGSTARGEAGEQSDIDLLSIMSAIANSVCWIWSTSSSCWDPSWGLRVDVTTRDSLHRC
jgi:predicted nucleotidyltransferase